MLTRATPDKHLIAREGSLRVAAGDAIQVLQDAVVLATVATDEGDDDEAPENARDQ